MRFFLWLAGAVILDQATKILALVFLKPFTPVKVIPDFFWLTLRWNTGAAFSLFQNHPWILTGVNTVVCGFIIWWGISIPQKQKLLKTGLALVAGGALGNLIDRYFRSGRVVDFFDFHWFAKAHWPTFNIADTAICIGVGLVILDSILQAIKEHKARTRGQTL